MFKANTQTIVADNLSYLILIDKLVEGIWHDSASKKLVAQVDHVQCKSLLGLLNSLEFLSALDSMLGS
jgi:hypothetical protein